MSQDLELVKVVKLLASTGKNRYQEIFKDSEILTEPPALISICKVIEIEGKKRLWVAIAHPNTYEVLWQKFHSTGFGLTEALDEASEIKNKLKLKHKTWSISFDEAKANKGKVIKPILPVSKNKKTKPKPKVKPKAKKKGKKK